MGIEGNATAIGTTSDGTDADQSCTGCSFWTSDIVRASLVLAVAICLEVSGTMCMKLSDGYRRIIPSILVFVFYIAAFSVVPFVLKSIPLSLTYAVWSGCGTVLVSLLSVVFFREKLTVGKALSILGVALSLALLNYFENEASKTQDSPQGTNASAEVVVQP